MAALKKVISDDLTPTQTPQTGLFRVAQTFFSRARNANQGLKNHVAAGGLKEGAPTFL